MAREGAGQRALAQDVEAKLRRFIIYSGGRCLRIAGLICVGAAPLPNCPSRPDCGGPKQTTPLCAAPQSWRPWNGAGCAPAVRLRGE